MPVVIEKRYCPFCQCVTVHWDYRGYSTFCAICGKDVAIERIWSWCISCKSYNGFKPVKGVWGCEECETEIAK